MTSPFRYALRVLLFLALVIVVAAVLHEIVLRAFFQNPVLNGLILGVLAIGIVYALRRIVSLRKEVRWIDSFRTSGPGFSLEAPPTLLAPVASALGDDERRGRASLSALSMRYILDSISARLDESRDLTRYQTGLLIFLGLLGTFYGLLETINAIANVISELSLSSDNLVDVFDDLKEGLAAPLQGMGTAFSSSLFGLAGSLILGFIDLQANQAQNKFYNETEEWLAGLTKHSVSEFGFSEAAMSGAPMPSYVQASLQQTAENLNILQESLQRNEDSRSQLITALLRLNERLGTLNDRLEREHQLIFDMVEKRTASPELLQGTSGQEQALRQLDGKLARLIEEMAMGREQMTRELKSEIKLVSRTIAVAAGEPQSIRG